MVNAGFAMVDDWFDEAIAGRVPVSYPRSARSYASASALARGEQADRLRAILGGLDLPLSVVADRVNAAAGADVASGQSLASMRAGGTIMSPRVALALSAVSGRPVREVAPHVEAMPWLSGRFRPALAGRDWVSIAAGFPDAVLGAVLSDEEPDAVVPTPANGPEDVRAILDRIALAVSGRQVPVEDVSPSRSAEAADVPPGVVEDDRSLVESSDVMLSLSRSPGGVRFVYRGMMARWRAARLSLLLPDGSIPGGDPDPRGAAGDAMVRLDLDVMIDAADAGPVVRVLGADRPRRGGWLRRLLSGGRR